MNQIERNKIIIEIEELKKKNKELKEKLSNTDRKSTRIKIENIIQRNKRTIELLLRND